MAQDVVLQSVKNIDRLEHLSADICISDRPKVGVISCQSGADGAILISLVYNRDIRLESQFSLALLTCNFIADKSGSIIIY